MAIDAGTIKVRATGDTRDAQAGVEAINAILDRLQKTARNARTEIKGVGDGMTEMGTRQAPSAARSLGLLSSSSVEVRRSIGAATQSISAMGGAAGTVASRVGSLSGALLGGFGIGGAIGLGIGAVVAGISALRDRMSEAAAEAQQIKALGEAFGVARVEVERVEAAFRAAGNALDRSVVQSLIATGREAGVSTAELAALAGRITQIQHLTGLDAAAAATRAAAERVKARGEDWVEAFEEMAAARDADAEGISEWERRAVAARDADAKRLRELAALHESLRQQEARAPFGSDQASAFRSQMRAVEEEQAQINERLRRADQVITRLRLQDQEQAQSDHDRRMLAQRLRIQAEQEAAARRLQADREAEAEREARRLEIVAAAQESSTHRIRILQAQAAGDRVAELEALAGQEIARLQALAEEHVELEEATAQEILAIRQKLAADIREVQERQAEEERRRADQARDLADRKAKQELDRERQMAQAGTAAGMSFLAGLKDGLESGDVSSIMRALTGALGAAFSIFAPTTVLGSLFGGLGGLFHDGGMVGTGGRKVPSYHSGGMITAHRGIVLPRPGPGEVPIMAQLGEGVLSRRGVAALGGAGKVEALNRGEPVASAPMITQRIYVQAMDPSSAVEAVSRVTGPAMYRRGLAYGDTKELALHRRRLAPRSGRI